MDKVAQKTDKIVAKGNSPLMKIADAAVVVALIGAGIWALCVYAAPPQISGPVKKLTHDAGLAVGLHLFDRTTDISGKPLTVQSLPVGYYIYVGEQPFKSAPHWMAVNGGHSVSWLRADESPTVVALASDVDEAATKKAQAPKDPNAQWEEYSYPTIKWKAKRIVDGPKAAAQLKTTYEGAGAQGRVKYQLTLLNPKNTTARTVEMLDGNGFKIGEFHVSGFKREPADDLMMTARDSAEVDEETYRQMRDYAVD